MKQCFTSRTAVSSTESMPVLQSPVQLFHKLQVFSLRVLIFNHLLPTQYDKIETAKFSASGQTATTNGLLKTFWGIHLYSPSSASNKTTQEE